MKSVVIPLEFLKAIGEKPAYIRIYWVKWLADYTQDLFRPDFVTFFQNDMLRVGKELKLETITEAYEFGITFFKDGFVFQDDKPTKSNSPEIKNLMQKVINYLNEQVSSTYTLSKANTECLSARIKEGYSFPDFKSVIDKKCKQWLGTEQQKYLRPITLFQSKKFENYLNEPEIEIKDVRNAKHSSIEKLSNAVNKAKQFFN